MKPEQKIALFEYLPNASVRKAALLGIFFIFSFLGTPTQAGFETNYTNTTLLQVINQDRGQNGVLPLADNLELDRAAMAKAEDILAQGYFAHISPQGAVPWDFIKSEGYDYAYAGENLALNYTNPLELEKDFLASPAHRDNLLSPAYSEIGIAVLHGTYKGQPAVITVQMFASPK